MKRITYVLVVFALVFFVGGIWYRAALRPVNANDDSRNTVEIEEGSSTAAIGQQLLDAGQIRSLRAFDIYTRMNGVQGSLQAGKFVLSPSMDTAEIVEILRSGKGEEMIITIPEGYTLKEMDALLAEKGLIKPGELIECAQTCDFASFEFLPPTKGLAKRGGKLEGYLFPDTYFVVAADFAPKFFLERLLTTFRTRVVEGLKDEIKASEHSLHEVISMASLIEDETRVDGERAIVSGILWKRLGNGLRLDVDATVRYIVEKGSGALTLSDLNIDSPYNTRKLGGLPPGPIASPGFKSIRAALDPQESKYWYYLHGSDGQIHYAESNEEHNINRYDYL